MDLHLLIDNLSNPALLFFFLGILAVQLKSDLEVDPDYLYPTSLASTVLEGSLHQYFLKEHFATLTDCSEEVTPTDYFVHVVFNALNISVDE